MRHIVLGILGFAAATCYLASMARAADSAGGSGKLLILPFSAINQNESQPWVGRSVQQSLAADLLSGAPGRVLSSQTPAADDAAALEAARKVGAQYVIVGEFASVGGDVRITGQVLDVTAGRPVTAIKATGPSSDLFAMEDELTAQIRLRLSLTPPHNEGSASTDSAVPPMQGLQMPPQPQADPYVQAYVAPLQNDPPAQMVYDYFYSTPSSNDASTIGMGWIWPNCGCGGGNGSGYCGNYGRSGRSGRTGKGGTRGASGGSSGMGAHGGASVRR